MEADVQQLVMRLANERPEWIPILDAACEWAKKTEANDGDFAGAWVFNELLRRKQPCLISNLRPLVGYGLLVKSGESTRGGNRAYYKMPQREAIERALDQLNARPLGLPRAGKSS
jgi:hypothetical protein